MAFKLSLGKLEVVIGADTTPLENAQKKVSKTNKQMAGSFGGLGKVIAGVISVDAVRRTVMLADQMNMLDARIRNVARSGKEFQIVRKGIRDIAEETGASIQSLAGLSQSLIIAADGIGATSDEIVTMTNNLSKLGALGGSSAEQMGNAMLQFGQAMAGGVVRAEEFNSIVENTPLIAKSIADGLGVSVGELRKMVIDGKLLSEDVFKALEGQTDSINKKFADMPLTVERAGGMIANAFATAVQEIDAGSGATEAIADSMERIAGFISSDLVPLFDDITLTLLEIGEIWDLITQSAQDSVSETVNWGASFELVKEAVSFVGKAIKELPANLSAIATILIGEVSQAFTTMEASVTKFSSFFAEGMLQAIASVKATFFEFIAAIPNAFGDVFAFFGGEEAAEGFRILADDAMAIAQEITANEAEQRAVRQEILNEEIEAINHATEVKIEASNLAIQAGIAETEAIKAQAKSRIEQMRAEIKARRESVKETGKAAEKKVKAVKSADDDEVKNKVSALDAIDAINKTGLINDKASAAVQIGVSASKAIAKTTELGFPAAIPHIATALGNIAMARQQLSGAGRQFGGTATGGMPIPVNEGGSPEMFVNNAGRQFLLPDQSGMVVPLGAGGGGSGSMSVTVINNSSAVISEPVVTQGQLTIEINNAVERAIETVNSSLSSGRGSSAEAVRSGFAMSRNI